MTEQSTASRALWIRLAAWLGLGLLLLSLAVPVYGFIRTSSRWLDYPFPRPGSEGLILYESLLLKQGGDIYSPISAERFISGPYPPVFYRLAAWVLPDTLPDMSDRAHVDSIFAPGRLIALVSTLVASALLVLLIVFEGGYYARGRRAIWLAAAGGLIGAGLLLTLPQVTVWATRFRGDMLMIELTAAGLTCTAVGAPPGLLRTRWTNPWLVFAAASFSLAFFTKQTALAGPIAAAAYLLFRDWRQGLRWCFLMFLAVALPFLALDIATGNWFYLKMVVYHSLPFSRTTLLRLLRYGLWDSQWPLILIAVAYVAYRLYGLLPRPAPGRNQGAPLLVALFVLASLLTLPTGGVVGADHNHLLMTGLAICAAAGALSAALLTHLVTEIPGRLALAAPAVVLLLLGYVFFTSAPSPAAYGPDLYYPTPQQQEQLRKIVQYVRTVPGALFYSDDPGFVALAGKVTPYDDPFTMTALANQGRWDESVYRGMLAKGEFVRLVLQCDVPATLAQQVASKNGQRLTVAKPCRADTFTPGVLDAINSGYSVLFRDVAFTYAPK